jgi:hypothetical protein
LTFATSFPFILAFAPALTSFPAWAPISAPFWPILMSPPTVVFWLASAFAPTFLLPIVVSALPLTLFDFSTSPSTFKPSLETVPSTFPDTLFSIPPVTLLSPTWTVWVCPFVTLPSPLTVVSPLWFDTPNPPSILCLSSLLYEPFIAPTFPFTVSLLVFSIPPFIEPPSLLTLTLPSTLCPFSFSFVTLTLFTSIVCPFVFFSV